MPRQYMKMLESTPRNVGIDALRVVAMFLIVLGHIVRFSFNYHDKALPHDTANYLVLDILALICLVGVNVYAMLSGYVMHQRPPRMAKLGSLWLQLSCVSLLVAGAAKALQIDMVGRPFWKYAFPISQNCWWYMTAYFGMYPILPFVNRALSVMTKREILLGGVSLLIVFCLFPFLTRNFDVFQMAQGYSVVWLLICYLLGAIFHALQDDLEAWLKKVHLSMGPLLFGILCLLLALTVLRDVLPGLLFMRKLPYLYSAYNSPLMVIYAVLLLACFSRLDLRGIARKSSLFLSSLTLPIYLFHTHPVVSRQLFFSSQHRLLAQNHHWTAILAMSFGYALLLFAVSAVLGLVQIRAFQWAGSLWMRCRGQVSDVRK